MCIRVKVSTYPGLISDSWKKSIAPQKGDSTSTDGCLALGEPQVVLLQPTKECPNTLDVGGGGATEVNGYI